MRTKAVVWLSDPETPNLYFMKHGERMSTGWEYRQRNNSSDYGINPEDFLWLPGGRTLGVLVSFSLCSVLSSISAVWQPSHFLMMKRYIHSYSYCSWVHEMDPTHKTRNLFIQRNLVRFLRKNKSKHTHSESVPKIIRRTFNNSNPSSSDLSSSREFDNKLC